jgi:hypothetical protein
MPQACKWSCPWHLHDHFPKQYAYKIIQLTHVTQITLRGLKEYAREEGVSAKLGVASESAVDLSCGSGVPETAEYWRKFHVVPRGLT